MSDQRVDTAPSSVIDPARKVPPANAYKSSVTSVSAQSIIGKTLLIKGEITGSGSVHIEGKVEGSLYGDIVVSRISVEEGAYLTGSIDIRREATPAAVHKVEERELVEAF